MNSNRDYNKEFADNDGRKYAYGFDYDVMHPYMIKSFEPFFVPGNVLELGCFKGSITKLLAKHFDDISAVEASDVAAAEAVAAVQKCGKELTMHNALFEDVKLPTKYDNIVMTHALEHLNDPVHVLRRINEEWLSDKGRFFLVVPNANAPSRQIAVKMGLIPHNSAVTKAEKDHGHVTTYTFDTLERDARAANLRIIYRTGIFFKAFANFQWDQILQTNIVTPDYLDGCYQLGQQYPDLCASIFLLCQKGERL